MAVTVVAGVQWGDEGKGRIVDLLAARADFVVRCQGGPNAGHTVVNDEGKFVLHTVPSGIFSQRAKCIIGAGTVINPAGLMKEIKGLQEAGVDTSRLLISERAHLIMPYHRLLERLDEEQRSEASKIASTGQGIGPAYSDKAARCGIRAGDLLDMDVFKRSLAQVLPIKNRLLQALYDHPAMSEEEILAEVEEAAAFLRPYVGDTVSPITDALCGGAEIFLEGQLGVMRDLDWGAYPFVTSSSPTPAGMAAGAGLPPQCIERVIGVVKAYTTAVGAGPFPTEIDGALGEKLRERGGEYGATTGRPRRCGWFDAFAAAWATRVAGFTEIALTKVDILSGFERLPMCVAYEGMQSFPTTSLMSTARPDYQEFPGWTADVSEARTMQELPVEARDYVEEIERRIGAPITMVSVGPERDSIIERAI